MKRIFTFCTMLLLTLLLPINALAADIVVDGVAYFNVVTKETSSMEELIMGIMDTSYNRGGSNESLLTRWLDLLLQLEKDNNYDDYNNLYERSWDTKITHTGGTHFDSSLNSVDSWLCRKIESLQPEKDEFKLASANFNSSTDQPVLCAWTTPVFPNVDPVAYNDHYFVYAVILSDFRIIPVVTEETYSSISPETWTKAVTIDTPTDSFVNGYTNNTHSAVTTTQSLSQLVSESLTNTTGGSKSGSTTESITVGLEIPITAFLPAKSKLSVEAGVQFMQAWGKDWSEGKTITKQTTNTSTVRLELPAQTSVMIRQSVGKGAINLDYSYPAALAYTVRLVRYALNPFGSITHPTKIVTTYTNNVNRNTMDARSDLYKRAITGGVTDPDGQRYTDAAKAIAKTIGLNVPMSVRGAHLNYEQDSTVSTIYGIRPLSDLKRVAVDGDTRSYSLAVGDKLSVDPIALKGLNASDVPYYGFDKAKGKWKLVDAGGADLPDTTIAALDVNPQTKATTLKANGAGTVYLKYLIDENSYPKVDKPEEMIKNSDLLSTAIIMVEIKAVDPEYTLVASGSADTCVGDSVDLQALDTISARLLDKTGKAVEADFTWEAQELERDGIKIENGRTLTTSKAGTFHIRARWGKLYSNWLPVTSRAARALTTITLKDPSGLLADWRWSGTAKDFDLTQLQIAFLDQYGEAMPKQDVKWYVAKDSAAAAEAAGGILKVGGPGSYACYAEADGIRSNALRMTVFEAPALKKLVIADDAANPLLADYILGSGSDKFQIDRLSASGYDASGAPVTLEADKIEWFANNASLAPTHNELTVTQPGRYSIYAKYGDVQSAALTLVVQPARTLATLTIADNPASPLLADYELDSGTNTFDLSRLTVAGADQYGQSADPGNIEWYVSGNLLSGNVLSVNRAGTYEIVAAAKTDGRTVRSNALTLRVYEGSDDFVLDKTSMTLGVGDRFRLVATPVAPGRTDTYSYTSKSPKIAQVDANGEIRALRKGKAAIQVRNTKGREQTCLVTVVSAPTSIKFDHDQIQLSLGDTWTLKPVLTPKDSVGAIAYVSSDDQVVAVDDAGQIRTLAAGKSYITATTYNGVKGRICVVVTDDPPSGDFPDRLYLGVDESVSLDTLIRAYAKGTVSGAAWWTVTSLAPDIVAVRKGEITALGVGEAMLRATNPLNQTRLCHVTVSDKPNFLALKQEELIMTVGSRYAMTALLPEASIGRVTYRSSKPGIARVSDQGTITAVKAGKAKITATAFDGQIVTCDVRVVAAPKEISLSESSATLGVGEQLSLRCLSKGKSIEVSWRSSDASIAAVDAAGRVTAISTGRASITAVSENGRKAACEIVVAPAPVAFDLPLTYSLGMGEKRVPLYAFRPAGAAGAVRITSDKPGVIMVDAKGRLVAKSRGTAQLTFTSYNNVVAQVRSEVLRQPASVTLTPKALSLSVGAVHRLTATLPTGSAGEYTFKSNNRAIATVDPVTGEVTTHKSGKARITVTTYNNKRASCLITVR